MRYIHRIQLILPVALLAAAATAAASAAPAADFDKYVRPFLTAHCIKCHGPEKQKGDIRLDGLTGKPGESPEIWSMVHDQIRDGLMPPKKEPKPDAAEARQVIEWAGAHVGTKPGKHPNHGNLIPHELLFGKPVDRDGAPVAASPARIWRLSPDGYMGFLREVSRGGVDGIVQPFTLESERGIKDYASLYTIDEPGVEILLRNAQAIVERQTLHAFKDGKIQGRNDTHGELVKLMDPTITISKEQLAAAVQFQHRMAVGRPATEEDVARFIALYEKCARAGDQPAAVKMMLQAVLLRADAMFRVEVVRDDKGGIAPKMLAPPELARAVSLALADRREPGIMQAAARGELVTKEQVTAHLQRMLEDPKWAKPRLLRFFREYFEYDMALDVFKDKPRLFIHHPEQLIADTDRLILHILAEDKDVFRRLLTADESFVNFTLKENKQTRKHDVPTRVIVPPVARPEKKQIQIEGLEYVYGVQSWSETQPMRMPPGTRIGILMQPSWLAAWSTNFDNDPVRRGRWIRERLLGGTVPDLPIGVIAQVPDDPHHTFRTRLEVTRQEQCWKCHQRMDELGLPFENFDHFGRFRTTETVHDPEATAKNVDKKGQPLGLVMREAPLVTTGSIDDSGDPKIDGPVKDGREMMHRIASSDRARQVFIRHVFRFYMGRNESLADAVTLREADRVFVESKGSFKALLISLLTSDAFLYRTTSPQTAAATNTTGVKR